MGFELKLKLEQWQVEKFLTNRHVIIAKDRTDAIRFARNYMAYIDNGNFYSLQELFDMSEVPDDAVCHIQSTLTLEELGRKSLPEVGELPTDFWRLPASVIVIGTDDKIIDVRDMSGKKWKGAWEKPLSVAEPVEFENPDWESGGRVHNWRGHVAEHVQEIWHTFTIDQKYALFCQAQLAANAEDWE